MTTIYDMDELTKKVEQQQAIIDHQREALQRLLNAIWLHINAHGSDEQLQDAFRLVTSASTMTGTSEE